MRGGRPGGVALRRDAACRLSDSLGMGPRSGPPAPGPGRPHAAPVPRSSGRNGGEDTGGPVAAGRCPCHAALAVGSAVLSAPPARESSIPSPCLPRDARELVTIGLARSPSAGARGARTPDLLAAGPAGRSRPLDPPLRRPPRPPATGLPSRFATRIPYPNVCRERAIPSDVLQLACYPYHRLLFSVRLAPKSVRWLWRQRARNRLLLKQGIEFFRPVDRKRRIAQERRYGA